MQSNLAIAEELMRISEYLEPRVPVCPNEGCELYRKTFPEQSVRHTRFGVNAHGTTWFDRTNYFASFAANEENLRWYLDMPPMTMVFKVLDATLLDKVKAGDQVNFSAEKRDGAFVVMTIEVAKK